MRLNARIYRLLSSALAEDIGSGDITSLCIPEKKSSRGVIIANEEFILCGINIARAVFRRLDRKVRFRALKRDGDRVRRGALIADIRGNARAMLSAERTAINFLQHLSGIATNTRKYLERAGGYKGHILDTRKTTPGLRELEKYAVRTGGASNHRMGLYDRVLIKSNHITAAGGIRNAVMNLRERCPDSLRTAEVEVRNLRELREALSMGIRFILIDNMNIKELRKAVEITAGRARLEASGRVGLKNLRKILKTSVDFVSIGGLTYTSRWVDISFRLL